MNHLLEDECPSGTCPTIHIILTDARYSRKAEPFFKPNFFVFLASLFIASSILCTGVYAQPAETIPKLNFWQEILKTAIPAIIGGGFAISSIIFNYFINIKYDREKFKKEKLEKTFLAAFNMHKDLQNLLAAAYDSQNQDKEKEINEYSEKLSEKQGELLVSSSLWVPEVRVQANELSSQYRLIILRISSFLHETEPSDRHEHLIQELISDPHIKFMQLYKALIEKIEAEAKGVN